MTRGLTLIELVIAVLVAGIIGAPVGLLVSEQLRAALSSRDAGAALPLARAELERVDSLNNFFAPDLALGTTVLANYRGFPYDLRREVTCEAGNCVNPSLGSQGIKRIRITVTRAGSAERLVGLTSSRTKHVAFGS